MRRLSLASLALLSLLGMVSCGGDEPIEPLADIRYTLGCGARTGCFSTERDINGYNAEAGTVVRCTSGSNASGATLTFQLSALDPVDGRTRFGIALSGVTYDAASGSPLGSAGRVTLTEGSNTYSGIVSANPPSLAAPCRVNGIQKTTDPVGNPQIEGDILCGAQTDPAIGVVQSGVTTVVRDVYTPGAATTAAHFRIALCDGLPLPG
jgi:hypothetical protein